MGWFGFLGRDNTTDIDFSVIGEPEAIEQEIKTALDGSLRRAIQQLGTVGLTCRTQRVMRQPRPTNFSTAMYPALEVTIGSAATTSPREMNALAVGQSTNVIRIDLSFREPIDTVQKLIIGSGDVINAYGLFDLVAEKIRAILQQIVRKQPGTRRQDVFDVSRLLTTFPLEAEELDGLHAVLLRKCRERGFEPTVEMIDDPRIAEKLKSTWPSLQAELIEPLPSFESQFTIVRKFYRALPWAKTYLE